MNMHRTLITGASGFLGSTLCGKLASHELYSLSRNPQQAGSTSCIVQDLGKKLVPGELPKEIDVVIHLAQSDTYRDFPNGAHELFAVNVASTFELLEYARTAGAKQFIYTSTGSIYQGNDQRESSYTSPVNAYPATKLAAEFLLAPYRQFFNVACLRLYFLYGPGQKGMMIPNIIRSIHAGGKVVLHGQDGLAFCPSYVDDVADVLVEATRKGIDGTYNVANPEVLSLRSASTLIGTVLDVEPQFEHGRDAVRGEFRPSLDRLREWYDVDNKFRSFSQGIAETIRAMNLD